VNINRYKRQLFAMEQQLLKPLDQVGEKAREQVHDSARDVGDEGVDNEGKEQQFAETNTDSATLDQVREALKRIENGTFGKCQFDGQAIEEKRLEAIPWTRYCLKHKQLLEGPQSRQTPTL
jgi:DnaK suppressor protein